MSDKVALWAFAGSLPTEQVVASLRSGLDNVVGDIVMDEAFIVAKEFDGVTFAQILATGRPPESGMERGAIDESLPTDTVPIAFLGYDDQNGIRVFDHQGDDRLFLMSDSALLGGNVEAITVEYAQRGFTNDDLLELSRRDAAGETLNDAEQRAIGEYDHAIGIGLRQVFGWTQGRAYLDICYEKRGVHAWRNELVDIPLNAVPLVAYWPDDRDWTRSKLEWREY